MKDLQYLVLLRRIRGRHAVFAGKVQRLHEGPPRIHVVDEQMHHEIISPFLDIVVLQQEFVGA
jgi:hypothetical protein